jgi:hypothetical protein
MYASKSSPSSTRPAHTIVPVIETINGYSNLTNTGTHLFVLLEPLAIRPQPASASPKHTGISRAGGEPSTVFSPAKPDPGDRSPKEQETYEGEGPACFRFRWLQFVAWCLSGGQNSRGRRDRDNAE